MLQELVFVSVADICKFIRGITVAISTSVNSFLEYECDEIYSVFRPLVVHARNSLCKIWTDRNDRIDPVGLLALYLIRCRDSVMISKISIDIDSIFRFYIKNLFDQAYNIALEKELREIHRSYHREEQFRAIISALCNYFGFYDAGVLVNFRFPDVSRLAGEIWKHGTQRHR